MPIPAVAPPPVPGTPTSLPPGTKTSRLTGTLDDSGEGGSGIVIPLNAVDENYVDWRMQGLDGWDSADLAEGAQPKVGDDGSWDALNYYAARVVTITGLLTAPTYEAREAAEYQLRHAVPARRLVQLRIDETIPKFVMGRRSGRLMITPLDEVHSKWSAAILAPDMRKYGVSLRSAAASLGAPGGGVTLPLVLPMALAGGDLGGEFFTVENSGGDETPPVIRIVGPGRDLGVVNLTTGASLRYPFELAATDALVIDASIGAAQLNGTAYRSPAPGSTVTSRFLLPPGVSQMQMVGTRTVTDVSPRLSVTWRDAWT